MQGNERKLHRGEGEGSNEPAFWISATRCYNKPMEPPLHTGLVGRPTATPKKRSPINHILIQVASVRIVAFEQPTIKSQISFLSMLAAVAMAFFVLTSMGHAQGTCDGDINGDGRIDGGDLAIALGSWGSCPVAINSVTPLHGSTLGGTQLTITGVNLEETTGIRVGGFACTNLQILSPSLIRAITPACAAGLAPIAVISGAGTTLALTPFTYVSVPSWATLLEFDPDPAVVTDANLRTAIAACGFPWRVLDNATNIELLLVPAGTFTMGCSASNSHECDIGENPTHQVTLTNCFYMGKSEVTQAQWTAEMGSNPSYFQGASYPDAASRPVDQVSWDMIQEFNTSTGLRLPTEAEWEYAYRAGTSKAFHSMPAFPRGTNDDSQLGLIAWYSGNAGGQTHAVGGKSANALGMHDIAGNVAEWCQDWLGAYSAGSVTNPTGPMVGTDRLVRGGLWWADSNLCRASIRTSTPPDTVSSFAGFRVVRDTYSALPTITSVSPPSGSTAGGTPIKITGTNLTGATSVTVGGVAATSVVVLSPTSITAVTPAGTGVVSVSVTTPAGTTTLPGAFSYQFVLPWATVLEFAPDPTVITDPILLDAIAACGLPWRVLDNATNIEMLLVPAGTFTMGCSASNANACQSSENPTHQVTLTNCFYMGKTEVTQAQWTAEMGSNPSYFVSANGYSADTTKPVDRVSWDMIQIFNAATGLRLPTEAEWEYAYRAATTTAYHSNPGSPNGTNDDNQLGSIAWYNGNAGGETHAVAGKYANAFGLHDMAGNVAEWVQDWSYSYPSGSVTNPTGPTTGSVVLLRGGFWYAGSDFCRASNRYSDAPSIMRSFFGFRVARNP